MHVLSPNLLSNFSWHDRRIGNPYPLLPKLYRAHNTIVFPRSPFVCQAQVAMNSQPTFDFAATARSGRQRPIVRRVAVAAEHAGGEVEVHAEHAGGEVEVHAEHAGGEVDAEHDGGEVHGGGNASAGRVAAGTAGRVAVGPEPTNAPPARPCPTVAPTTGATAPPTTAAPSTIAPNAKAAPPLLLAPPTSVELRLASRLGAIEDEMCAIQDKLDQLLVLVQERFCC
jgi:hypothetical protein